MKQVNLTLLFLAVFTVSVFAQDPPIKSFKQANKSVQSYVLSKNKKVEKSEKREKEFKGSEGRGIINLIHEKRH